MLPTAWPPLLEPLELPLLLPLELPLLLPLELPLPLPLLLPLAPLLVPLLLPLAPLLVPLLLPGTVASVPLDPDEALPYQVYARDSSFMTPWGAVVTQMHQWWRRGEYAPQRPRAIRPAFWTNRSRPA